MLSWLSANWINILLVVVVAAVVALIVRSMVRGKKAGKLPCGCSCSGCGGACTGCAMHGACCSAEKK